MLNVINSARVDRDIVLLCRNWKHSSLANHLFTPVILLRKRLNVTMIETKTVDGNLLPVFTVDSLTWKLRFFGWKKRYVNINVKHRVCKKGCNQFYQILPKETQSIP